MSNITRRDFINGTLVAAGASLLAPGCEQRRVSTELEEEYYPPALTGLRGSHAQSFAHAHWLAFNGESNWGRTTELNEVYDLVVVGGGISGLAAALFFQQKHGRDKRILILDNHDDFGGHAKRNEHSTQSDTRLIFGGSQSLASPHTHSQTTKRLLTDLGVDLDRFKSAYDADFYVRNSLKAVTFFDERTFGQNKIVSHPFCSYPWYVEGLPRPTLTYEEAVSQTPLDEEGRRQLLRVLKGGLGRLDVPKEEIQDYISSTSYFDFLRNTLHVDHPDVLSMARFSCADNAGPGTDVLTIEEAMECGALGLEPEALAEVIGVDAYREYVQEHGNILDEEDPYIHHFPDGNATIARMMVRQMIPKVGSGDTPEEILLSRFDYRELDKPNNVVRLRLNSTVVGVEHLGDPESASEAIVKYITRDKAYQVKGRAVVMACYNMMIPYIVPTLPREQAAALSRLVKIPLQYTTVGLRNWRAMKEAEIGMAMCPGNMHQVVMMDFPVSMGGYEFTKTPDDPCAIVMIGCPLAGTVGATPIEQFREARTRMLSLGFQDYEDEIREHLGGMLSKDHFEFDRDVESITVNRWAHGYAYGGSKIFDSDLPEMARKGRQKFGRITIASIDSALSSYVQVAIDQAWRAVEELG